MPITLNYDLNIQYFRGNQLQPDNCTCFTRIAWSLPVQWPCTIDPTWCDNLVKQPLRRVNPPRPEGGADLPGIW